MKCWFTTAAPALQNNSDETVFGSDHFTFPVDSLFRFRELEISGVTRFLKGETEILTTFNIMKQYKQSQTGTQVSSKLL